MCFSPRLPKRPSFGVDDGGENAEFCLEHAKAGMVRTRRGRTSSSGSRAAGSRCGESYVRATMSPSSAVGGSSSCGTGDGSRKRSRQASAVPSLAVPVKPEEAERLAEDVEGAPSQPCRSRDRGGLQLRPPPPLWRHSQNVDRRLRRKSGGRINQADVTGLTKKCVENGMLPCFPHGVVGCHWC